MVGKEDLINAIALNSSMFNGARDRRPGDRRHLVAAVGEGWCFFANAVSYIAVITGLMMMQITRVQRPQIGSTSRPSPRASSTSTERRRSANCSCCSASSA